MPTAPFYCKSIKRATTTTTTTSMDIVRRIAMNLSGGLIVEHLDDISIIYLLRTYTSWNDKTTFEEMRKKIAIIEHIEGVDLDSLVSVMDMHRVFIEICDLNKYPPQ